jgi:hypothetical protein
VLILGLGRPGGAAGAEALASGAEVAVVWISPAEPCPVEPAAVFSEVDRVFRGVPMRLRWRLEPAGSASPGGEVRIIALRRDPARRPHPPLGMTPRPSKDTAWVLCSEVARAVGSDPDRRSPLLDVAVARVTAHELVHVFFSDIPHGVGGLMAPVVDAGTLTGRTGELDEGVRLGMCRRLERAARAIKNVPTRPTLESGSGATVRGEQVVSALSDERSRVALLLRRVPLEPLSGGEEPR